MSKKDELESKKDLEEIMCEVKNIKVPVNINTNPTLKCANCKFNTTSNVSLEIHMDNVH